MKSLLKYSLLLAGCTLLVTLSCEDIDIESQEAGEIRGFWKHYPGSGNITYLDISDTEVIFYNYDVREQCITVNAYRIERIDGTGFYILGQEGLEGNLVLAISRNGERLDVRDINETQKQIDRYYPSEEDVNSLPRICINPIEVFGNWEMELEEGDKVFLSVEEDSIKVIDQDIQLGCYSISALEVIEYNGNDFLISDNNPFSSGTQQVKFTRTYDGLEVERMEGDVLINELFTESEEDLLTLTPICVPNPLDDLEGTWQYNAGAEEGDVEFYLTIDQDAFVFHFRVGDPVNDPENVCFQHQKFEIISVVENAVTIRDNDSETTEEEVFTIEYREEEGLLYIDNTSDVLTFFPSNIDQGYINNQCTDPNIPVKKIF
jgi:hypothetical protein